jgi:transcriptional regulator with XRE-family HTH domain
MIEGHPRIRNLMNQLAAILKVTGTSAASLAEKIGCHRQELNRWMRFDSEPQGETTLTLAAWVDHELNTTLRKPERRREYEKALAEIENPKGKKTP